MKTKYRKREDKDIYENLSSINRGFEMFYWDKDGCVIDVISSTRVDIPKGASDWAVKKLGSC